MVAGDAGEADGELGLDGLGHIDDHHPRAARDGRRQHGGQNCGIACPGAEGFFGQAEALLGGHVAGDREPGPMRRIAAFPKADQVVAAQRADGGGSAVAGVGVGMRAVNHARGDKRNEVARVVEVDGQSREHLLDTAADFVLGEARPQHDVGEQLQAQRGVALHERAAGCGDVVARASAHAAAAAVDQRRDFGRGVRAGAFAQQAGDQAGQPGERGFHVAVAGQDFQGVGDDREAMILNHIDGEAVGQLPAHGLGKGVRTRRGGERYGHWRSILMLV